MGKRRMRKRYEAAFKARVALAGLKDDRTLRAYPRSDLDAVLPFLVDSGIPWFLV